MVTITATGIPRFRLPTRSEWQAYMRDRAVVITMIICVTLMILGFVGALVYLAVSGHSSEALTAAVIGPLVGVLVGQMTRLKSLEQAVRDAPAIPTPTEDR